MTQPIVNSLDSTNLSVTALMDPARIKFFTENVAAQINGERMKYSPQKRVVNLSDHLADVIIETNVQGASQLEVHVIDPALSLLARDSNGASFIDADQDGYLWPPIEVNFPPGKSDSWWRLCQLQPSTDLTQANLVLVFEDKIASELREITGPEQSNPNETRAEFIYRLIKQANQRLTGHAVPGVLGSTSRPSTLRAVSDPSYWRIRFIPLLPRSVFNASDLTAEQLSLPSSALQPDAPPARKNPNKGAGPSAAQGVAAVANGVDITITGGFLSYQPTPINGQVYIPPNISPTGAVALGQPGS